MSSTVSAESLPGADPVHSAPSASAGKRDVWLVFWIVPAFFITFGVIFFALARESANFAEEWSVAGERFDFRLKLCSVFGI